jgi:serine/threonine protein kinase
LGYAHGRGVVHCDLKPANILFTGDGAAKVADFGIAHVSEEALSRTWATSTGFAAGTMGYMSPEQARGERGEARLDLYALGAVLYRMLTGRAYLDFDLSDTPRAQMENLQRVCEGVAGAAGCAAGSFRDGAGPYGVLDMAGNVGVGGQLVLAVVPCRLAFRESCRTGDRGGMGAARRLVD